MGGYNCAGYTGRGPSYNSIARRSLIDRASEIAPEEGRKALRQKLMESRQSRISEFWNSVMLFDACGL